VSPKELTVAQEGREDDDVSRSHDREGVWNLSALDVDYFLDRGRARDREVEPMSCPRCEPLRKALEEFHTKHCGAAGCETKPQPMRSGWCGMYDDLIALAAPAPPRSGLPGEDWGKQCWTTCENPFPHDCREEDASPPAGGTGEKQ
jgi:hypothetical protein